MNPDYIPAWEKGKENAVASTCTTVNKCVYPECVATSVDKKIIPSAEYQVSSGKH